MDKSVSIFVSYAHADNRLRIELGKHLSQLKWQNLITLWDDQEIDAGIEWEREIKTHLSTADIVLLLISPDFMASPYCYDIEMKQAMERHERGEARVIPIILRPVDWHDAPFGRLQALPTDAQPIQSSSRLARDKALFNVAKEVKKIVEEHFRRSKHGSSNDAIKRISIDSGVLALLNFQKEICRDNNISFLTPHMLLALLAIPGGCAELAFNSIQPGLATSLQETLNRYIATLLKKNGAPPFAEFQWEEREDIQRAMQLALEDGCSEVGEKHMLLGVLETRSATQQDLRKRLKEDNFSKLVQNVRTMVPQSPHVGTPGSPFAEWEGI